VRMFRGSCDSGSNRSTELWSNSLSSIGIRPLGSVNQMRPFLSMARSLGVLWRLPFKW